MEYFHRRVHDTGLAYRAKKTALVTIKLIAVLKTNMTLSPPYWYCHAAVCVYDLVSSLSRVILVGTLDTTDSRRDTRDDGPDEI